MSFGDTFRGSAEIVKHNERRQQNEMITLRDSWIANGTTFNRIKLLDGKSGFSNSWQRIGGAKGDQYNDMSYGVTITQAGSGKPSALTIMMDISGKYTLTKSGELAGEKIVTNSGNKVLNAVNTWLMDVGAHYNFDVIATLQRATDEQERALAQQRQAQRHGK